MIRVITRHSNRKLYDPTARRYVSLSDIVDLVLQGDSIRVVEHPGGGDATARILAQALVDLVKRRASSLPSGLMETLLRLAGGARFPETPSPAPLKDLADRTRREAEAIATRLVARGRLGIEEALHLRKEVEEAIERGVEAAEAATRRPLDALRPGHAVRTISGLARELKALEGLVSQGPTPSEAPAPKIDEIATKPQPRRSRKSPPNRRSH